MMFFTAEELIRLNERMILFFGGFVIKGNNVANRGSLDYLVEAVPSVVFGQERYVGIFQKAAAYAFLIITGHVFRDGNKRAGMQAAIVFLEANGHRIISASDHDIVRVAVQVARGEMSCDELAEWFESVCTA